MSNDLFQLAGFFWNYRETGGTMTAAGAADMHAKLTMLAEGVEAQERALTSISDEFDRYIEDQHSDQPYVPPRGGVPVLEVVGGRDMHP